MDVTELVALLALGTISAVILFAFISKRKTEQLRADDDAPKSTLAADAPNTRK